MRGVPRRINYQRFRCKTLLSFILVLNVALFVVFNGIVILYRDPLGEYTTGKTFGVTDVLLRFCCTFLKVRLLKITYVEYEYDPEELDKSYSYAKAFSVYYGPIDLNILEVSFE